MILHLHRIQVQFYSLILMMNYSTIAILYFPFIFFTILYGSCVIILQIDVYFIILKLTDSCSSLSRPWRTLVYSSGPRVGAYALNEACLTVWSESFLLTYHWAVMEALFEPTVASWQRPALSWLTFSKTGPLQRMPASSWQATRESMKAFLFFLKPRKVVHIFL